MKKLKLLVLCVLSITTPSIGLCQYYESEISGVSIWLLNSDDPSTPYPRIGVEEGAGGKYEFVPYCNGVNTVYVPDFGMRIRCKSVETFRNSDGYSTHSIYLLHKGKFINKKITVSKKNIGKIKYIVSEPSIDDKNLLADKLASKEQELESANMAFVESGINSKNYSDILAAYRRQFDVLSSEVLLKKTKSRKIKIVAKNKTFFILPIGAEFQGLGWNLRSAVFLKNKESLDYIGQIDGCLENILDINSDGIPEVGASLCENDEGSESSYWSIFPLVKRVVSSGS